MKLIKLTCANCGAEMEMDADRIRRDWNSTGYDPIAPRTTDLRREAVNEALETEKGKRRRRRNKQ